MGHPTPPFDPRCSNYDGSVLRDILGAVLDGAGGTEGEMEEWDRVGTGE